jgi:hypothetical protein
LIIEAAGWPLPRRQAMPHGFVLFEQGPGVESVLALAEQEHVRAVASSVGGAALVFVHSTSANLTATAVDRIRGSATAGALGGLMIPIPPLPVAVGHMPGASTLFVLVELERGRQHSYAKYLESVESGSEEVKHAAGLVLGCPRAHALLEVVGEDWPGVLARLDLLTAHDDVKNVQTIPAAAEHIRGAGSELAWGS